MKLTILTNQEFDHLGWATTDEAKQSLVDSLRKSEVDAEIREVDGLDALQEILSEVKEGDLVWGNTYHLREFPGSDNILW